MALLNMDLKGNKKKKITAEVMAYANRTIKTLKTLFCYASAH